MKSIEGKISIRFEFTEDFNKAFSKTKTPLLRDAFAVARTLYQVDELINRNQELKQTDEVIKYINDLEITKRTLQETMSALYTHIKLTHFVNEN